MTPFFTTCTSIFSPAVQLDMSDSLVEYECPMNYEIRDFYCKLSYEILGFPLFQRILFQISANFSQLFSLALEFQILYETEK